MNILYIAYQFPPLNLGGSARPAKFVKNLPQSGITPVLVTLHPLDFKEIYPNATTDSGIEVREDLEKIEVPSDQMANRRKSRFLNFIDIFFNIYRGNEKKHWEKNYHRLVDDYLSKNDIKAIVVTAPPFGILPLAAETSKKHKLPLIVDMRDHWTLWITAPYGTYLHYLASKHAERKIFKRANKIIATSKVTLEDFKAFHPSIGDEKFAYIPNGFEKKIQFEPIVFQPKEKIKIGYVGSFYYSPKSRAEIITPWWQKSGHRKMQYVPRKEDWLYRTPYYFFKALSVLFLLYPILKEMIIVEFVGKKDDWFDQMVQQFELEGNVKHLGWMKQKDAIAFQKNCNLLLLTSAKVEGGKDYSIAGKTFEYFSLQKPILAFVSESAQRDLLQESGMAKIFPVDDSETAALQLKELFTTSWSLLPNQEFINSFNTIDLSRKFSEIIKEEIKI